MLKREVQVQPCRSVVYPRHLQPQQNGHRMPMEKKKPRTHYCHRYRKCFPRPNLPTRLCEERLHWRIAVNFSRVWKIMATSLDCIGSWAWTSNTGYASAGSYNLRHNFFLRSFPNYKAPKLSVNICWKEQHWIGKPSNMSATLLLDSVTILPGKWSGRVDWQQAILAVFYRLSGWYPPSSSVFLGSMN